MKLKYIKKENDKTKTEKRAFMKPGRTNQEDRINFIKFWVRYIKTHSDEEWSEQQNIIIDSQIK